MAEFVLVHGAWHGGWCWERLVAELEAAGHRALAPDLPGHGADDTPHDQIDLRSYTDHICDVIDGCQGEVVLVGHSLGGLTISQVAEHRADRIRGLVYLTAFVPELEGSVASTMTSFASEEIQRAVVPSEDGRSAGFDARQARDIFYGDCSADDTEWAVSRLGAQPMAVFTSEVRLSGEGFGSVERHYVVCTQDRAIAVDAQEQMAARHSGAQLHRLERSHSPFLSAPAELAKLLGEIALS